jgi:hypothetical protein
MINNNTSYNNPRKQKSNYTILNQKSLWKMNHWNQARLYEERKVNIKREIEKTERNEKEKEKINKRGR